MLGQLLGNLASPRLSGSDLDALMARHDGLVHAVLRRQWGGALSYDERLQVGRIGLWHALQGYDPDRGFAFSTYAWSAIEREIWRAVRQSRSADPPPWLDPSADRQEADRQDRLAQDELELELDEALLQAETRSALHALVGHLPTSLRQVVIAYYGLADQPRRSLRQLGRELGLSHEAVRLRLWAALVWLRHPRHSLALRQLLGHNTVADYESADALAQRFLCRRGGRQCPR